MKSIGVFKRFVIIVLVATCAISLANPKGNNLHLSTRSQNDSIRIASLLSQSWALRNSAPEESLNFGIMAINLATKNSDYENLAKAHSFVGVAYRIMGNYSKSIDHYYTGLEIANQFNIIDQQGFAYLNLANLHIYQEYYTSANENIRKAEEIAQKIDNKNMLAYAYLYYGRAQLLRNELKSALKYFEDALSIRKELNKIPEQAVCYKYIGDIYFEMKQFSTAIENYNKLLETVDQNTDKDLHASILVKKAMIYLQENDLNQATILAQQGLSIGKQIGASLVIRDASSVLGAISLKTCNFKDASNHLQYVIQYNDTLFGQQLSEKIFFLEYHLERQQRENKIDLLNKDNTIKELELNRAKTYNLALIIILFFIAGLFVFALISLKERRKRTKLLEQQNNEIIQQQASIKQKNKYLEDAYAVIEGYNAKITDSIRYAKKIQEAILPGLSIIKPYFSDNFCFYLPKDFVSGDFYWITIKNQTLFVAVADCTGHGVPGAFMSIIGMDLLSQAVNQQNIIEPAEILDFINIELRNKLRKEDDEEELILKDSMDIAIFTLPLGSNTITYSGALIPLTIIRESSILEFKPDFTSIGISSKLFNKPFKQERIEILPGDWIYLYSDGFMDQFGGPSGKKLMRKRFFSSLLQVNNTPGINQKSELKRTFSNWKGNIEQIDDVLVLGLKV
jgi:serine phosphatase RsbU (regulator of sigma subunit)